jgi:hypothetical protein
MLSDAGKGIRTSLQPNHPSEPPPFPNRTPLVYQWPSRATFVLTSPDICTTPVWTHIIHIHIQFHLETVTVTVAVTEMEMEMKTQ